ncbi:MAG: 4Fe-4S dicluster domain-containing protein [Chloroflexi bacterium]|nr:4Fe-4S dicluster domain-containing protein [Chloroflexota bacterium]
MNMNSDDSVIEMPPIELADASSSAMSRRDFLKIVGAGTAGLVIAQVVCVQVDAAPSAQADIAKPKGMVIGDPTRCTGCRRCEIACTSFNDGKNQPSLARIKVARNLNFGPDGAQYGYQRQTPGHFGNFLIVQETCRQCAHPVPCMMACPNGAIEVTGPVNARIVNTTKCTGCRQCQAACPWDMTVFDEQLKKASKCHLCNGEPECVKACPNAAIRFVPWQDRSKDIPKRWVVPAYLATPPNVSSTCGSCHK